MVVKRPQFLWQQQLHFIHESVVGGPQASGAGSCHRGGLGIDSSRVGAPLCPRSWLTTKGGSSLSLCSAGASASALGRPSPALAARGEAPVVGREEKVPWAGGPVPAEEPLPGKKRIYPKIKT